MNKSWTRTRRVWVLVLVLLVHAVLIAVVAGMRSSLHVQETAPPAGVGVILFRWPGFGRPEVERRPSPMRPRTKQRAPEPPATTAATTPAAPSQPAAPSTLAPVPGAPAATGQLPAGLGRIIAQHARCYGFRLTDEERARCAKRDVGREETEAPLNIPPAKVRGWEADQQRRRAPPGTPFAPCSRDTGGSNMGVGCVSPENGVHLRF